MVDNVANNQVVESVYRSLSNELPQPNWRPGERSGHRSLICREARKRGLTVDTNDREIIFRREDRIVGALKGMMPHTTSWLGYRVCKSKAETRAVLGGGGLAVPVGSVFGWKEEAEAREWVKRNVSRYVLKPAALQAGSGVVANLTLADFDVAWKQCCQFLKGEKPSQRYIVIEEYVPGFDIRVLVVAGEFLAATLRVPANVIGDGVESVSQLIEKKNKVRRMNPYLRGKLIGSNDFSSDEMQRSFKGLTGVPKNGEIFWLSSVSNIARGGDPIDVTDYISDSVRELAESAVNVVPGLDTAGVDIIVDRFGADESQKGVVIEVNACPNICMHHFPLFGQPRNVAAEIVERLFL